MPYVTSFERIGHEKIPADLIKMNFELDGSFPVHQPDPLDFENLKDLQKKVLEEILGPDKTETEASQS